jgi:methyl-accepting chemotaxis protein
MNELEDLKKKIDHLEYDEINPMKEDINEIKVNISKYDLLIKQALESNKKVSDSLEVLKDTMVEVSRSVRDSNRINDEITKTIEELNKRISSVDNNTKDALEKFETKITEIDNKSKLDIMLWVKNNWFGIIGVIGIIYTIIKNMI